MLDKNYSETICLLCNFSSALQAQSIQDEDLRRIREAVVLVCGEFAKDGTYSEVKASGTAGVELTNLARILVDVGIQGDGDFLAEEYVGVLREELGEEIISNRTCRMRIWSDIVSGATSSSNEEIVESAQRVSSYGNSSGLFDCKTTQFFEVCVSSSRLKGDFADLSLTLRSETEDPIRLCQSNPHAYAISSDGKKAVSGSGYDCRKINGGGIERYGFLFEFDGGAGESFDATVIFTERSRQFTFRDLR